jgi:hypothetical protein
MLVRWTFLVALAGVLGPTGLSTARAGDSEALVEEYLEDRGAQGYTIRAVSEDYIDASFPGTDFFEVWFRQYPVAVAPLPKGLSYSNLFVVQNGQVFPLVSPDDLEEFFLDDLPAVQDDDGAADAGLAWLRLSEAFSQDGFYTFADPQVKVAPTDDGGLFVAGSVTVTAGGKGSISVKLLFDADGVLYSVSEKRDVHPGVRPICQATKLLDADPLVRRMAEQDILVMGRSAKGYLDEQRAKAKPELKEAIDRIWKRIVDEGW